VALRKTDYENYDYREFWENNKRLYEDRAERIALRGLLGGVEKKNKIFFDIGCGYGRLFNEYMDFGTIFLVDSSLNNLKNARNRIRNFLNDNPEKMSSIYFIASDASSIPVRSDCADVILTVRIIHHLENPGDYFDEVSRILKSKGLYLLEFANKRNLKNILRFFTGKMEVSPFNLTPSRVGETILNFHPEYIYKLLKERSFSINKIISVSNFRINFLKRIPGTEILIFFEKIYQKFFSFKPLGPSIFLKTRLDKKDLKSGCEGKRKPEDILVCAFCKKPALVFYDDKIICRNCGRTFVKEEGIFNFKV
jgi:ubiquinone/menaquinone biosynthesis C-methylase UbiE